MEIFEMILLMLSAVFLSNVLSRFIPNVAFPLIQIFLGVCLAVPLANHSLELSPELFLLLFMAPLLFNDGVNVDKKAIWKVRKPILALSIGLVFVTVGLLGVFIHWLLPTLPFAAAFALAAALAPTDAVAVGALAKKVKVPHTIMHTLEGESLINDASGLVSFQFAVAALLTGSFSLIEAGTSFLLISIGGLFLGAVMSLLKIILMRWLRQKGLENSTSFILMEVLLPFLIFMVAEKIGVNGILAVVSGGIVHSFSYKKLNPEIAQLNLLSKSTWSLITFSLNGLVFVLLGTQLPQIMKTIWQNEYVNNGMLIFYIVSITIVLLGLRFLWIRLFHNFEQGSSTFGKKGLKNTFLYTISGVRGTITLVSALSLPFILNPDEPFMERDLLISIAAGVILLTLLLANFTLPLFAPKAEQEKQGDYQLQLIAILRRVTKELRNEQNDKNEAAIGVVIRMYNDRIFSLSNVEDLNRNEKQLRSLIMEWQLTNAMNLLRRDEVSLQVSFPLLRRLNRKIYMLTSENQYKSSVFYRELLMKKLQQPHIHLLPFEERRRQRRVLYRSNRAFVLEQLKSLKKDRFPHELVEMFILVYERMDRSTNKRHSAEDVNDWLYFAIQKERDYIQKFFEKGKISRGEMKLYRENLLAIENSVGFVE